MAPDSKNPDLESVAKTAFDAIQKGAKEVTIRTRNADGEIIEIYINARQITWKSFLALLKSVIKIGDK